MGHHVTNEEAWAYYAKKETLTKEDVIEVGPEPKGFWDKFPEVK